MDQPTCPSCGNPVQRVLDLSYGYWEWNGTGYAHRTSSDAVAASPFSCDRCLKELPGVHPHDYPVPRAVAAS